MATPEKQKWVAKLLGFDYEIWYQLGRKHFIADALFRKQGSLILHHISFPQIHLWDEIKQAAKTDSYIQSKNQLAIDKPKGPYIS